MAREKPAYRDNLELILQFTGGTILLDIKQVCQLTGLNYRTVKKRYPFDASCRISAATLARELS